MADKYYTISETESEADVVIGKTCLKRVEVSKDIEYALIAEAERWELLRITQGHETQYWNDDQIVDHSSVAHITRFYDAGMIIKDGHFYGTLINSEDVASSGMSVTYSRKAGLICIDGFTDGKTREHESHSGSEVSWEHDVTYELKKKDAVIKTLYLAGGCFWGAQRFFDQFEGVIDTEVGYANGPTESTDYKQVCASSGHAETVRVKYDECVISTEKLLEYYFMIIDPLSVNKQGEDEGVQYRTGVYYEDPSLLPGIRAAFDREQAKHPSPMAVELKPLENFCPAEEYHQKYLVKNPNGYCHVPFWLLNIKK